MQPPSRPPTLPLSFSHHPPSRPLAGINNATVLLNALQPADGQASRVDATPFQFHFHAASEHLLNGKIYPLELHVVSRVTQDVMPACPATGCFTVVGIFFELAELDSDKADNAFLSAIFDEMPLVAGKRVNMTTGKSMDFSSLLPSNKSYATYSGSLTTPPCSEGILWHVMLNSVKISFKQWEQFKLATGGWTAAAVLLCYWALIWAASA
jgi:carbonic anhydrase